MSDKDWLEDYVSRVQSVRDDVTSTCYDMEASKAAVFKLRHAVSLLKQAELYIEEARGMIGEER